MSAVRPFWFNGFDGFIEFSTNYLFFRSNYLLLISLFFTNLELENLIGLADFKRGFDDVGGLLAVRFAIGIGIGFGSCDGFAGCYR